MFNNMRTNKRAKITQGLLASYSHIHIQIILTIIMVKINLLWSKSLEFEYEYLLLTTLGSKITYSLIDSCHIKNCLSFYFLLIFIWWTNQPAHIQLCLLRMQYEVVHYCSYPLCPITNHHLCPDSISAKPKQPKTLLNIIVYYANPNSDVNITFLIYINWLNGAYIK